MYGPQGHESVLETAPALMEILRLENCDLHVFNVFRLGGASGEHTAR